MASAYELTPSLARRLAITCQRLADPRPSADANGIIDVIKNIGCLQIDPMSVVAPSHLLVLWSRVGNYDISLLDSLLWKEHALFEDWAHATSIVLTEDYPVFSTMKRNYGKGDSAWARRVRGWIKANNALHRHVLGELRRRGPLALEDFDDVSVKPWRSSGWTSGRNVDMMLTFLSAQGKVVVAGRSGRRKMWDLAERWLPESTPRDRLSWHDMVYRAAQRSLRALGVATAKDIEGYYIRHCYPGLPKILLELELEGLIERVQIRDSDSGRIWLGEWYVHKNDLPLVDKLSSGNWGPRTTLLSPFDNLIYERRRTERVFNFEFSLEIYLPKAKRRYGCYVMPIVHGDQLIGRIDPRMDRERKRLSVNAIYAERDAPMTAETGEAVAGAIRDLGTFLGAEEITFGRRIPEGWKMTIH
ncbi:MAG: crosslink repair DNA glycosylase YcaQ family protein [Candidatus Atabeyarchaeum deiterrae]